MSILEPTEALNWDFKQQQLFITYFNNLPEKPSSTVRFFSHGDFYSLQGDDAKLASDFTGNIVKYMGDDPKLGYITLKKSQFELFIRELLLVRQYRVEVYVKTSPNKVNSWNVEFRGSPGNLVQFEEVLFDSTAISFSNYVMGIKVVRNRVIAVACVNSTESKIQVGQLSDNECFTELEALIAQIGPRECLIPSGDSPELVALRKVLERNGVLLAPMKRADFNSNDVIQDLNRLLFFHDTQQRNAAGLPETQLEDAMGCLNAIIKFLNLTGDEQNFNQFKISTIDVHRFVRLDNAALYSLNILPKPGATTNNVHDTTGLNPNSSKSFHLMGILDMCVTSQGRRLLEQWIKHPLKDVNLINERLDIVKCFVKDPELRQVLAKDTLTRLNDLLMLSKKLSSKKANLQDCYKVYQIVASVPNLIRILKKAENNCVDSALVDPINEIHGDLEKYQAMIEEILDMDLVERDEFLIKSSFDPDLQEIYDRKIKIEEKIQKQFRNAADDLGFDPDKTIKLECNDQYGYFFRVTLKEEHALRSNSRYQILGAIKGGVRFTNNKLSDLNRDYEETKKEYEEQQKNAISEIFDVAVGYSDTLRNLNYYVATVDVLVSFANVAINAKVPYVRPVIHKEGTGALKLEKIRHPCLEQQDHISFIPNSIEFSRENDGKTFHIITGPNMCGKSTFIRSVGVCVLMAQIGSFVPCLHAEIPLVDSILARVGAEDCELKGLSTFMLEMIETATIIKTATANSLVIIDELGRGTSTYDGCGTAYAIAEHLAKEVKCFSLFATHFHEITKLADNLPCVNNLHVTAITTNESITPLYQIRQGECDSSYGIHCARMADFPDDVIQLAVDHQKRLEHAKGTQFIKDYEQVLKRKVIVDGDEIVKETLRKLKSLADSGASDEELANEIKKIKTELKNCDNLFIKGLLSQ